VLCYRGAPEVTDQAVELPERNRVIPFGELDRRRTFADVRAAWCDDGMAFSVRVSGKAKAPWCRESRMEESDGFFVWIDTRDTHNVHRGSRFCHCFAFLPAGGGRRLERPLADQLLIHRARENAKPVRPGALHVASQVRRDGYLLTARIPASALTGFQVEEYPKLGFFYAVRDRELGHQTFSVDNQFPYESDPSLWGTLELTR
jgi:hypothetical protein